MVLDELNRIQQGWRVVGSDGSEMGKVAAVHEDHLVVEAGTLFKHNLYVPVTALVEIGDERVSLNVPAGDADELGWRYPPEGSYVTAEGFEPAAEGDTTTMTGAGYGAGAGASSGGPLAPGHGDAVDDRLGGSGRAGLSGLTRRPDRELEPEDVEVPADMGVHATNTGATDAGETDSVRRDDEDAPPLT
ncbi:MAG TPA: DUF2171 domain-containing protein [Candidatus Caenarcaniphilales bacterium]|nr:DUF2171 domain-containing protein [Candidatus Caenarcaniphilales bacterium]